MTQEAKCFGLSLGIHLLAAACIILAASRNIERTPKAIMVVLDNFAVPEIPRQKSIPTPVTTVVRDKPVTTTPTVPQPRVEAQAIAQKTAAPPETVVPRDARPSLKEPAPTVAGIRQHSEAPVSTPLPNAAVSQRQLPAAEAAQSPEKAQQRYLKEHFIYIRDLITKRLIYPPMARKMGWSGKTTVAFVIAEDGTVHNLRVVETSGYALLDKSASETVRITAPFPKPPVRAEIVVPISFKML